MIVLELFVKFICLILLWNFLFDMEFIRELLVGVKYCWFGMKVGIDGVCVVINIFFRNGYFCFCMYLYRWFMSCIDSWWGFCLSVCVDKLKYFWRRLNFLLFGWRVRVVLKFCCIVFIELFWILVKRNLKLYNVFCLSLLICLEWRRWYGILFNLCKLKMGFFLFILNISGCLGISWFMVVFLFFLFM